MNHNFDPQCMSTNELARLTVKFGGGQADLLDVYTYLSFVHKKPHLDHDLYLEALLDR